MLKNSRSVSPIMKISTRLTIIFTTLFISLSAYAEPYLAVRTGLKCMTCHVNPSGGGKRTVFGNVYAQNSMSATKLLDNDQGWYGRINDYLAFGGDLRMNANLTRVPDQSNTSEFKLDETLLYFEGNIIPGRVTFYFDERVAPGSALNRESYALLWTKNRNAYLKAGRFFLASGYRIEDDAAFIRQVTGVNYNSSDTGIEAGIETTSWSISLSVTNGSNGGTETNNEKQFLFRTEYVQPSWRLGFGVNHNSGDEGKDRTIANVFSGFKLWDIDWLGEIDFIDDQSGSQDIKQAIYYLEANHEYTKGHNLKLSLEYFDPNTDIDENHQTRTSFVWEYSPFEHTQLRSGLRLYDGIPQNNAQNRDEYFIQLHNYF